MSISPPENLYQYADHPRIECLNQAPAHPISSAFKEAAPTDESTYLESDTDEQLLIHIPFKQSVKIHSIVIQGHEEGSSGPHVVKLFVNSPTIGFSDAADSNGTQTFELSEETISNGTPIPVRFVKFQNVTCLTLFIESNQNDEETTVIKWIKIMGFSGEKMDVAQIKKVGAEEEG